ncbi:MAG: hypothetical protein EPN25_14930 [Nitrospirae bacterium]|nr:MAG: hypothetical protein EPN25_14930 [Nitrospirota bacterium]
METWEAINEGAYKNRESICGSYYSLYADSGSSGASSRSSSSGGGTKGGGGDFGGGGASGGF